MTPPQANAPGNGVGLDANRKTHPAPVPGNRKADHARTTRDACGVAETRRDGNGKKSNARQRSVNLSGPSAADMMERMSPIEMDLFVQSGGTLPPHLRREWREWRKANPHTRDQRPATRSIAPHSGPLEVPCFDLATPAHRRDALARREVALKLKGKGLPAGQIAKRMGVSRYAVHIYIRSGERYIETRRRAIAAALRSKRKAVAA